MTAVQANPSAAGAANPSPEADAPTLGPMMFPEFVALVALMTAIVALSIDAMMSSLPAIASDLGAADANAQQLVIIAFMLGLALSPVAFGVAADAFGRKPVVFAGLGLFGLGCLISATAVSFEAMIFGRVLQGVGAAAPRTLAIAIVRDRFEGRPMARVMSFVMMTFVLVPLIAPSLGLAVELAAGWRAVFLILFAIALIIFIWAMARLPETLTPEARRPICWSVLVAAFRQVLGSRKAMGHAMAMGLVLGAFLAFLSSAEQVLGQAYGLGHAFAPAFSGLALAVGVASVVNSALVMHYGMRRLCGWALAYIVLCSAIVWMLGAPPLIGFAFWAATVFFCFGVLSANLNALAMQPLGAVAGLGAAIVGSVSTLIAVGVAFLIAQRYAGDATPIIAGFCLCAIAAGGVVYWAGQSEAAAGGRG